MIYGFVGSLGDNMFMPLRGNGKTITMTYFLYQKYKEGLEIYTNYNTSFSKFIETKTVADMVFKGELENIVLGIDEIQQILENMGQNKYKEFMGDLVNESRKDDVDIYFTTQRFYNLLKRFRLQVDRVIVPKKYHKDTFDFCDIDKCVREHFIQVFFEVPYIPEPAITFDCVVIGELYDTRQRLTTRNAKV